MAELNMAKYKEKIPPLCVKPENLPPDENDMPKVAIFVQGHVFDTGNGFIVQATCGASVWYDGGIVIFSTVRDAEAALFGLCVDCEWKYRHWESHPGPSLLREGCWHARNCKQCDHWQETFDAEGPTCKQIGDIPREVFFGTANCSKMQEVSSAEKVHRRQADRKRVDDAWREIDQIQ